eukprot:13564247-Ditylum_brightwellii.AAC.1
MEEAVGESKEEVSEVIGGEEDETKPEDNMDVKTIMAFVGIGPEAKVDVWLYDQDKEKYLIDRRKLEMSWEHKLGPV